MTIKQNLLFDYNEHYSFIGLLEKQAEIYDENVLVHHQLPNEQKFKAISYAQAHRIATNLAYKWAPFLNGVDTVALLQDNSVHYLVTMLAIFKLKVALTILSPSNTIAANLNLLTKTGSGFLFVTKKYTEMAKACTAQVPEGCEIKVLEPLDFDDACTAEYFRHEATASDIEKTVLILHTSGTTSLPKPIRLSNRYMVLLCQQLRGELQTRDVYLNASDAFLPLIPLHHVFGVLGHFMPMLYGGSSLMFDRLPVSPRDIAAAVELFDVSVMLTPPVVLNQVAQYIETTQCDVYRRIKACICGGATLSKAVGDFLCSKGIRLSNGMGSTETMGLTMSPLADQPKKWYAGKLYDFIKPYCIWEPVDQDMGVFHLVVKGDCPVLASGIANREDGNYATNDLFIQDQQDPEYWHYFGRNDNMLAMENGKKTNPTPMEETISDANIVRRCIVIGENRQCISVLVELEMEHAIQYSPDEKIAQVHEAVKCANQAAPAHSRIFPSMVYILPPGKQLPTTPKGGVIRKRATMEYEEQIDKMYYDFLHGPATTSEENFQFPVKEFLVQAVCQILQQTDIDPNTSLFDYGLDSLLAIQLRNLIATRFENVPSNFLFEHPTLVSIEEGLVKGIPSKAEQLEARYHDTQVILESYLERASFDFPVATNTNTKHEQHTVLLTGATGSLGAYLLRDMILSDRVKKIYCLVRGDNPKQRVQKSFQDRRLDTSLLKSKVEILSMDLNAPLLGCEEATYTKLKSEVTIVQHCAWLVDFNQPVQHFEHECIRGMYNLLKFAYREIDPIHVHVASSISATAVSDDPIVPEEVSLKDPHVAMPIGYAQSKYVVEHLFNYLTKQRNFPCTVERMGQVCGDTKHGVWNTSEQYPLLMVGGTQLNLMPDLQGATVDWLPVDIAATSIVDIMLAESSNQGFYHIVNPNRVTWSDVLKAMDACGMKFQVVKPEEWVQALSKRPDNPAYRLMSFFDTNFHLISEAKMPIWQTDRTIEVAPRLVKAPPFSSMLLEKYLAFWQDISFYNP